MAFIHLASEIDFHLTHLIVAIEKVAEYHILTKYSECNSFQVISDLVLNFMNLMHKNLKKDLKIIKKDPGLIVAQRNLLVAQYICARQ